jgi:hypothetical protein
MSRPFQVVVQTDLDIAPLHELPDSHSNRPVKSSEKVMVQISALLGLRSNSPAALDVGDIVQKLYLMACETDNVRDGPPLPSPSNTVVLDRLVGT